MSFLTKPIGALFTGIGGLLGVGPQETKVIQPRTVTRDAAAEAAAREKALAKRRGARADREDGGGGEPAGGLGRLIAGS